MRLTQLRNVFIIILSLLACILNTTNAFAGESSKLITFVVSPDDALIYSIREDRQHSQIRINDAATGMILKTMPTPLVPTSGFKPQLAMTPDGKKLYIVDVNKLTYVLDLQTYQLSKIKNKPKQDAGYEYSSPISMMPDGKRLYIAEGVGQIRNPPVIHVIDTVTNHVDVAASREHHYDHGWFNGKAAYSNTTSLLYLSRQLDYYKYEISILDTRTNRLLDDVITIKTHMTDMAIHPVDGKLFILENGIINIMDPVTKQTVDKISLKWVNHAFDMAFALNGSKLVVLDDASMGTIHIIDLNLRNDHELKIGLNGFYSDASEVKSSDHASKLYISTMKGTILVIDANTDTVLREIS